MDELHARLERLQSYLRVDPNNINLICDLTDLHLHLGQMEEARQLLERSGNLDAHNTRHLFQCSQLLIHRHQFADAVELLLKLQDSGVDNAGVRYNLALCHSMLGNLELATTLSESLHASPFRCFEGDLLHIRMLHHAGKLEEATALGEALIAGQPEHAGLLGLLALVVLDGGDLEKAGAYARRAYLIDADNLEALITLGTQALEAFELEQAKRFFENATQVKPEEGRGWLGSGLAALQALDLDLAESCLEKSVQLLPGYLVGWNTLAWTRILMGDVAGAEQAIATALDLDAGFAESFGTLAVIRVLQGRRAEAEEAILAARKLDEDSFAAEFAGSLLVEGDSNESAAREKARKILVKPAVGGGITINKGLKRYLVAAGRKTATGKKLQ